MKVSFDPWYFCQEAADALRKLKDKFGADNPLYKGAEQFVRKMCPSCSEKLPKVHLAILRTQKITQGGSCCGPKDMCELLNWIQQLRPVTPSKLLDSQWKYLYATNVNHKLCCIQRVEEGETVRDENTFPHLIDLPNTTTKGLAGFRYPTYRIPPLIKLNIPDTYEGSTKGKGVLDGVNINDGVVSLEGLQKFVKTPQVDISKTLNPFDKISKILDKSLSANGTSKYFGRYAYMYMNFPTSPMKFIYDLMCGKKAIQLTGGFSPKFAIKMPNLSFTPHVKLNIDPCLAKMLPPMSLPTNELKSLKLGDGEEYGIYSNYRLEASNFGTQFDGNSSVVAPVAKTEKDTFARVAIKSDNWQHQLTTVVKKSFPSFDKDSGYAKGEQMSGDNNPEDLLKG